MKMKTVEFITLSACTMMLTALGIDIMLPVFGEIRQYFNLGENSNATAQIVVFFFLGQIAQIIFGVLSDRFGRLAILRIGFPLYIIGGIAATFAPGMGIMFAARFLAGVGASAVFMTTIAGVRDRFVGDHMARILSLIFTIFLSTPVFAPFLGLAILSVTSWRMVFLTPPLFAVIVFIWSLRLEESLPKEKRSALSWNSLTQSIKKVLGNKVFLRYTGITTMLFAGLSSWVSSSEHIVSGIYGKPALFAWIFAAIGLWMAFSTLTNSRLSLRYGARQTIRWLLTFYMIVAAILLLCTFLFGDPPQMSVFFVAIAMLMGINLAVEPNSSALAMEPMGDTAGVASSVYGTIFFFIGGSLGSVISTLIKNDVLPLIAGFFMIGIITLILVFSDRRPFSLEKNLSL
jgi:DHA1 family bicyclomycin/chloramphenicol resistance-like MFS transporter